MSLVWIWGLFSCLLGAAYGAEVCFDGLGCFDDQAPWGGTTERPISRLPWDPEMIGTRFLLFTPKNRYYQEIKPDNDILGISNYAGFRRTKFIIPGYLMQGDEDWAQAMCKAMLKQEGVNCIAMEWKKGVKTQYVQAANNARVVGAQVAHMINVLMTKYKQKADKFHIIGHSLGAHAAGETGRNITGLARITGLDPAEPYFQGCDAIVRLDITDALFVDVIHTDGLPFNRNLGLGISDAIGHIDFYPNGGELMPGCRKNTGSYADLDAIWEGTKKFDACNHVRSYQYYTESTTKRHGFVGYPCANKESFEDGQCFPCTAQSCPLMGHHADKYTMTNGTSDIKFFLNTGDSKPFGLYSYRAKVTLDGPNRPHAGFMYVALYGDKVKTKQFKLHVGLLISGKTYEVLVETPKDPGEVKEVKFRWNNHVINPMLPKYGASKIVLVRGKDAMTSNFCATENVGENVLQSVLPCKA